MPSSTKNAMIALLMRSPQRHRVLRSRKVRENCCMPIWARQTESGTDLSASQVECGHRYSKPSPFRVNSTSPNAVMWNRYQK